MWVKLNGLRLCPSPTALELCPGRYPSVCISLAIYLPQTHAHTGHGKHWWEFPRTHTTQVSRGPYSGNTAPPKNTHPFPEWQFHRWGQDGTILTSAAAMRARLQEFEKSDLTLGGCLLKKHYFPKHLSMETDQPLELCCIFTQPALAVSSGEDLHFSSLCKNHMI